MEGPVTLIVQNDAGDITITGGDSEKVEIKIVKTGYALSPRRVRRKTSGTSDIR